MDVPESPWGTASPYVQAVEEGGRRSWVRWTLAGGALAALAVGVGAYAYLGRATPLPVSASIDAAELMPGSPSPLRIRVLNASPDRRAYDVEVRVTLPERTRASGIADEAASSTAAAPVIALGELGAGESREVSMSLDTELDPSSAARIGVAVSYRLAPGSGERLLVTSEGELVIREPAVSLTIDAPGAVARGDAFEATVRYRNNADQPLRGARLALTLPRGLALVRAVPAFSGTLALPDLAPRQSGTVVLALRSGAEAPPEMPVRAELSSAGVKLAERESVVRVASDALSVRVTRNGAEDGPVSLGQTLGYEVTVRNLSSAVLRDVRVEATLEGPLYDLATVAPRQGALAAGRPVVSWDGVGVPGLRALEPGAEARVSFSVRLVQSAPAAREATAVVTATASSPTVPPGVSGAGVRAAGSASGRLAARVAFGADAYWRDPLGQIANAGPQPPRVGVATQYVIRWTVQPSYAGIADAEVAASLPPGVRFTGVLGGTTATQLTYDTRTGTVTWRPGAVAAGAVARAALQVEIVPAPNQAGDDVQLVGQSVLTATDAFARTGVRLTASALSNNLSGQGQPGGVVRN